MNKTVNINIGGMVFYIEEQAFEKLKAYLENIKNYFSNTEGGKDIIEDIESRIAELFSEKLSASKQVLLLNDIDSVIEIMGKPENFATEGISTKNNKSGIESGSTSGYVSSNRKRVFRDPDEKVIGGVCSGIAHYFGIDPVWLRIILAIAFLGFGAGFWVYIILWVIIPEAKTTADKLEMRGEPVNIANIEKSIREELEAVRSKMNKFADDVSQKPSDKPFVTFIQKLVRLFVIIFKGGLTLLARIVGGLAIFIGLLLLIVFSALFFGSDNVIQFVQFDEIESFSLNEILSLIFVSSAQLTLAKIGLALILGSVVIWLLFSGVRVFFKLRQSRRLVNAISLSMLVLGLVISIIVGVKVSNQFSNMQRSRSKGVLNMGNASLIYLSMNLSNYPQSNSQVVVNKNNRSLLNIVDDQLCFGYPKIDVVKSDRDSFEIEIVRTSRGESKKDAFSKAENLGYEYFIKDSSIMFNPYFIAPISDKFRAQQLKVVLKVPVGKMIYLEDNLDGYIYDIGNVTNTYDADMLGRRWLMTKDGLSCVDCEGIVGAKKKKTKKIIIKKKQGDKITIEEITEETPDDGDES